MIETVEEGESVARRGKVARSVADTDLKVDSYILRSTTTSSTRTVRLYASAVLRRDFMDSASFRRVNLSPLRS